MWTVPKCWSSLSSQISVKLYWWHMLKNLVPETLYQKLASFLSECHAFMHQIEHSSIPHDCMHVNKNRRLIGRLCFQLALPVVFMNTVYLQRMSAVFVVQVYCARNLHQIFDLRTFLHVSGVKILERVSPELRPASLNWMLHVVLGRVPGSLPVTRSGPRYPGIFIFITRLPVHSTLPLWLRIWCNSQRISQV